MLNAVELVLYGLYALVVYNHGVPTTGGAGVQVQGKGDFLGGGRKVRGKTGNRAVLIGFAAAVMTLSKTVLYCKFLHMMVMAVEREREREREKERKKERKKEKNAVLICRVYSRFQRVLFRFRKCQAQRLAYASLVLWRHEVSLPFLRHLPQREKMCKSKN